MTFTIESIVGFFGSLMLGIVGFIFNGFSKRIDDLEKNQTTHELHVANEYVKHESLKEIIKPLFHKLDNIEEKVNQTNYELARKQDRP